MTSSRDQINRRAREATLAYLADQNVLTLATCGPLGLWAAAVFYANREFQLYFLSASHTRHAQNMAAVPRIAGTIQADYSDWPAIKGIQLEGLVTLLAGQNRDEAIAHYSEKFPFIRSAGEPILSALDKVNWYCLLPEKLYFIDNSKGFGYREEIDLQTS